MSSSNLSKITDRFKSVIGSENAFSDPNSIDKYSKCTLPNGGTKPTAIIKPANNSEIIEIVKIANEYKIPLYPISTGKNWGYGDACAPTDGQVILDLSRMNRILEVNEELAYAVIEPGVTQGQLSQYLRDNNIKLWMDCTGAGPDTSIVGNVLERGFGHSPYANRFQNISGMEVVLANGEVLKTGFGHYKNTKTTCLFPWGPGPILDGLFTQSNMGIVTKIGFWLMPEPECFNFFACLINKEEGIGEVINILRKLKMDGVIRSNLHIANDLRVISGNQTYPYDLTNGKTPLPDEIRTKLRRQGGFGAWNISGGLYGTKEHVAASRKIIRRLLSGKGRSVIFLNSWKLKTGHFLAKISPKWKERISPAQAVFDMHKGIPSNRFLIGAYWRNKNGMPKTFPDNANPATDGCGLIWITATLPAIGKIFADFQELIKPVFIKYEFEYFITASMVNERSITAILTVSYDKENEIQMDEAKKCQDELLEIIIKEGFIPYRLGLNSTKYSGESSEIYLDKILKIKSVLDPNNIISPKRYVPED